VTVLVIDYEFFDKARERCESKSKRRLMAESYRAGRKKKKNLLF